MGERKRFRGKKNQESLQQIYTPNENTKESQYWLDYIKIIPILSKAVQDQQEIINNLKFEIDTIKNEILNLKNK